MSNLPPAEAAAPKGSSQRLSSQQVEEIYGLYQRDLSAFLVGVLRNRELAQDALQQTFQRVAESGGSAKQETLRGWLFQVAYREALQIRRREQRDHRVQQAFATDVLTSSTEFSLADHMVTREQAERLRRAIQELPPEQRQVVERRIQGEETFVEIAASFQLPLGTVLTRMRTAILTLRKQLHDE